MKRLAHCCSPELLPLLELPGVKAGRGRQLLAAGFTSIQAIARADTKDLVARVEHLSMKVRVFKENNLSNGHLNDGHIFVFVSSSVFSSFLGCRHFCSANILLF